MEQRKNPGLRKKLILGAAALTAALLLGFFLTPLKSMPATAKQLHLNSVTQAQSGSLEKLCKVWGYAKYYHPALATGKLDCDKELLELIPKALDAPEDETLLLDWLESLGDAPEGTPPDLSSIAYEDDDGITRLTDETALVPETDWQESLSPALSAALTRLSKTYVTDRDKGPAYIDKNGVTVLDNENPYNTFFVSDARFRLLSLFRYWNIIEYFCPNRDIPGENWDAVLTEFIPKFLAAEDDLSYKLTVSELTARIQDSHTSAYDRGGTLIRFWGVNRAPATFLTVDGRIVIDAKTKKHAADCPLEPGDVVTKLDGRDIRQVIAEKRKYISFSNQQRIVLGLRYRLFATQNDSMLFTVERDGKTLDLPVKCYRDPIEDPAEESYRLLEGNIGLINPEAMKKDEIHSIMETLKDTKGLIIDLRQYPADFLVFSLAEYIMPDPAPFAKFSLATPGIPGQFSMTSEVVNGKENPDYYKGKVILLMNEQSASQPEYTVMALRRRATVVGSASIGADGNNIRFSLPGGIETSMSAIGVYYPDGSPTQRVGISPDVEVLPTVEGLRQGRDELLEKAIELIEA